MGFFKISTWDLPKTAMTLQEYCLKHKEGVPLVADPLSKLHAQTLNPVNLRSPGS